MELINQDTHHKWWATHPASCCFIGVVLSLLTIHCSKVSLLKTSVHLEGESRITLGDLGQLNWYISEILSCVSLKILDSPTDYPSGGIELTVHQRITIQFDSLSVMVTKRKHKLTGYIVSATARLASRVSLDSTAFDTVIVIDDLMAIKHQSPCSWKERQITGFSDLEINVQNTPLSINSGNWSDSVSTLDCSIQVEGSVSIIKTLTHNSQSIVDTLWQGELRSLFEIDNGLIVDETVQIE